MNVRALKQQENIRKIDFAEHILGFRFGPHTQDHNIYRPFATPQSSLSKRQNNIRPSAKVLTMTSARKMTSPDHGRIVFDNSDSEGLPEPAEAELQQDKQLKRQQERHIEFIRSYQGWLNDTYADSLHSSRFPNSFNVKKCRSSMKMSRGVTDSKFHQLQGGQYKQTNIFPCRSLRKLGRKQNKSIIGSKPVKKTKNQAGLKQKLIKQLVKNEVKIQHRKICQTSQSARNTSQLLRTFSNPKILAIENRQLVRGTKILLL